MGTDLPYQQQRHEKLAPIAWDESALRTAIARIVEDAERCHAAHGRWPMHPLDREGEGESAHPKSLYLGDAGTLWALRYLRAQGAASVRSPLPEAIAALHGQYLAVPDTGSVVPSWFLGETGIVLLAWRSDPDAALADYLYDRVRENIRNPTLEALWGAPGTMLAALFMLDWTADPRWRELYLENAGFLWDAWLPAPAFGCRLWTQDLYGSRVKLIGAGHGFAGNAYALLRGAALLPAPRRELLHQRIVEVLEATARRCGGCANWPQSVGTPRPGRTEWLAQWCHGAPGMITALADFPAGIDPRMDLLLGEAGELVWQAGPLAKGAGLCHGTAGNGFALLKLYRRSGELRWLERARAFAMHAIGQYEQAHARYGRGRHTLWTGDLGLAVYLWHCITGDARFPTLDFF